MPIKKTELYAKLWNSCDDLRGSMDASQYKDYVLVMLFLKYISDKYAGQLYAPISVPSGSSFADLVQLKGKSDIGDQINKKIIAPLITANQRMLSPSDFPDFNDSTKLGSGKEMVDRLTNLIANFEAPELNFARNRADDDDILGDAYEYLMRHFATQSGKSKGQFYTPAEVSRIMASIIGIANDASVSGDTTAYDPTCGSGSLLLKVASATNKASIALYGQEMDATTSGLARMNMILHNNPTAVIRQGNTLANPQFTDEHGQLRLFDYIVANPPFSDKRWSTGLDPINDPFGRFRTFGVPPLKQGDYAFLLHIVHSLKSTGTAACILPHGVLFRGNAEGAIRRKLIEHRYIKGIIGLPANLFYGTGIPACIIVIDKKGANTRHGIFMVDASAGYSKDGAKNRLRERDIHRIVDTFNRQIDVPGFARMVPLSEIADPKNDFNLNLPRYIDSSTPEDIHDLAGHLHGGIPVRDIDELSAYWRHIPDVRQRLFAPARPGYMTPTVPVSDINAVITQHPQFARFRDDVHTTARTWTHHTAHQMGTFAKGRHPQPLIDTIANQLLIDFSITPLIDHYALYQHLMDYWTSTMQDDAYLIAEAGWVAEPTRIVETDKKGATKDKGWRCDLVPKSLIVARYYAAAQASIDATQAEIDRLTAALAELEEEHGGDEGVLGALDKIAKAEVSARLKEIKGDKDARDEQAVLTQWLTTNDDIATCKRQLKTDEAELDAQVLAHYTRLTTHDIQTLVIHDKWLAHLSGTIDSELSRVTQTLTSRIRQLVERYETPLPTLVDEVNTLAAKVEAHLARMGVVR